MKSSLTTQIKTLIDNTNNKNICLLIRHAEKQLLKTDLFGNNSQLTEDGIVASKALGNSLKPFIEKVHASPLVRCIQTAEYFLSDKQQINHSKYLGGPGVFIKDAKAAGKIFIYNSPQQVANILLTDKKNPDGFYPSTASSVKKLLNYIFKQSQSTEKLSVFITHDIILATIIGYLFNISNTTTIWPNYLEHLLIWKNANNIQVSYKEKMISFNKKDIFNREITE